MKTVDFLTTFGFVISEAQHDMTGYSRAGTVPPSQFGDETDSVKHSTQHDADMAGSDMAGSTNATTRTPILPHPDTEASMQTDWDDEFDVDADEEEEEDEASHRAANGTVGDEASHRELPSTADMAQTTTESPGYPPPTKFQDSEVLSFKRDTLGMRTERLRKRDAEDLKIFEERVAYIRTADDMAAYQKSETAFLDKLDSLSQGKLENRELDNSNEPFLPEFLPPTSCLSHVYPEYKEETSTKSLAMYTSTQPSRSSMLYQSVHRNMTELKGIKNLHAKITGLDRIRFDMDSLPDLVPRPHTTPHSNLTQIVSVQPHLEQTESQYLLKRSIGPLLSQTGFDGIFGTALCTLTDLTGRYIQDLGRTLKIYIETRGRDMSLEVRILIPSAIFLF